MSIRKRVIVTVVSCFAIAVLEGFDIQALGVAAPKFAGEITLTPGELGWVFAISNIGLAMGAAFGGWFGDRYGRKPVLVAAVASFGLLTFATSLIHGFATLFCVRLLAGLGFGGAMPNMMALATDVSPPRKRSSTAAAIFSGLPLGGGLCALVTQILPPAYDWRVLFQIGGAVSFLLAPALYLVVVETWRSATHSAAAAESHLDALFGEDRTAPTLLLWVTFVPTLLILYMFLNWLPMLVVAKGFSRVVAPQTSMAFNLASVAGALIFSRSVDRFGTRWPLALAYGALIASLLGLGAAHAYGTTLALCASVGFFLMGANYSLYGIAAAYYPQPVRGKGAGASVAVGRLGSILGPLLAGLLLGAGFGAADLIYSMAPVAAVAAAAVFALSYIPLAAVTTDSPGTLGHGGRNECGSKV